MSRKRREIDADEDGMRPEYDFSQAKRVRNTEFYARSANFVVLDPDVAEAFPDSESVNRALRALAASLRAQAPPC